MLTMFPRIFVHAYVYGCDYTTLEPSRVYKRKNGFGNTATTTTTIQLMKSFTQRQSTSQQTSQEIKSCTPVDAESVGHSVTEFQHDTDVKSK